MLKREFKIIKDKGYVPELTIYFEDQEYEMLEIFFTDEVRTYGEELKKIINKVISGESDSEYFGGNACGMNIEKDKSVLINIFAKSGEDDVFCSLNTKELLEILNEWNEHQKIIKKPCLNIKSKSSNIISKIFK
ncbi:MAG: hypothetical protein HFI36_06225 [Bacilli bacterium]|nr:hypothetical protein [Bacilli bacterium]